MAPPKTTPSVLEGFYNVKQAAVRLGLADPKDPNDESGQRWLRDGCNRPEDGSKGQQFPHLRMSGKLMFSDSDLAEIADMHRNAPRRHASRPRKAPARKATAPRRAASKQSLAA